MNVKRALRRITYARTLRLLDDDDLAADSLARLNDIFARRSVALVGNAQSIFERQDGGVIDSHDVVIRINRGFPRRPENQGSRTDVLGLAADLTDAEIKNEFGEPRLVWLSPIRALMSADVLRRYREIAFFPHAQWRELSRLLAGARPSAGMILGYLLSHQFTPSKVTLFGFDWKQSKTFYHDEQRHQREGLRANWHNWSLEQRTMMEWSRRDDKLVIYAKPVAQ